MRDIYSIIVCIDTFDLTEGYLQYHQPDSHNESFDLTKGYLQYHQPDSDNESFDLTEGYLQYYRMYWYIWSYWGIFTVSSYALIHVILLRDIYTIIVYIDTCGLTDRFYSIIVCIDTFDLTEGYLQYHRM